MIIFVVWIVHFVVLDMKKTKSVKRSGRRLCDSIGRTIKGAKSRQWWWS